MLNILSYLGMSVQSEVCLWTLLGLLRTIFDATLFKVNSNLKQVWQMTMPRELTLPVQRVLRTLVSGVMLVHCFTLYVYLASFIVLLYPVFLEERPNLVVPWLLLSAIRNLLCELMSLAMGLGVCVLLGPARPPCIRFVVIKLVSIMPAFYMWMLMFSYYHSLKNSWAYKSFGPVHNTEASDFGLELAVRRRRTKSLLDEDQLRKKLITNFYNEERIPALVTLPTSAVFSSDTSSIPSSDNIEPLTNIQMPSSGPSNRLLAAELALETDTTELVLPRNADRIIEQFILMMLKIGSFLNRTGIDPIKLLNSPSLPDITHNNYDSNNLSFPLPYSDSLQNGSTKQSTATYMKIYPQIFTKKRVSDSALDVPVNVLTPAVPIFTNINISQPQSKPVGFTTCNRTSVRATKESVSQSSDKVNNTLGRRTHTRLLHSTTRTQISLPGRSKCNKADKSKPLHERGSSLDTAKPKTVTTTQVTTANSITIIPPPLRVQREPAQAEGLREVKLQKTYTIVDTPSTSHCKTNVTVTRVDSQEAGITELEAGVTNTCPIGKDNKKEGKNSDSVARCRLSRCANTSQQQ